jgi:hypothetical protein
MRFAIAAALALNAAPSLEAQTATTADLSFATPIAGSWNYAATADGSEANFADSSSNPQLWIHCTRATRRVTISKPSSAAAPFLIVWTSSLTRSIASSFNPGSRRLTIELGAYDPLLDAITSSRGRVGFTVSGQLALVVPARAEASRVIEDCRV